MNSIIPPLSFVCLRDIAGTLWKMRLSDLFDVIPFAILGAPIESYFAVKVLSEIHQIAYCIHPSLPIGVG
jgi:hypothetical protein